MHLICEILQPFIFVTTGGLMLNVVKMRWPNIPKLMKKSRLESVPRNFSAFKLYTTAKKRPGHISQF
jgi:hypothetical protein